jgi:hypothetical protein
MATQVIRNYFLLLRTVSSTTTVWLAAVSAHVHSHIPKSMHAHLVLCCGSAKTLAQVLVKAISTELLMSYSSYFVVESTVC